MENITNITELTTKRISLLSAEAFGPTKEEFQTNRSIDKNAPEDKFYLVYLVLFFMGLGSFLPLPFFITANDYWMYKFRNTSLDTVDSHQRTALQANFLSINSISHSIPSLITTILAARYAHKINIRKRLVTSMSFICLTYVVYTAFIIINTDSWQLLFFIMIICISSIGQVLMIMFAVSMTVVTSRFPYRYMKAQMYGRHAGGILSSILQILALSMSNSSTTVALIYFSCGTLILFVTLIFTYMSKYLPLYNYYLGNTIEDMKRSTHTFIEIKRVFKKIWPILTAMISGISVMGLSHPNISSLVVSEYYHQGSAWGDKYFVPVITYLLPEVVSLIAQYFATPFIKENNVKCFVTFNIIFIYATSPLYMLCNALPRKHLPVVFSHDWEYISIHCCLSIIKTYLGACTMLSMPNLTNGDRELTYLLMNVVMAVFGSALSPLNALYVNLL